MFNTKHDSCGIRSELRGQSSLAVSSCPGPPLSLGWLLAVYQHSSRDAHWGVGGGHGPQREVRAGHKAGLLGCGPTDVSSVVLCIL